MYEHTRKTRMKYLCFLFYYENLHIYILKKLFYISINYCFAIILLINFFLHFLKNHVAFGVPIRVDRGCINERS